MTTLRILGRILAQAVWWQVWPWLPNRSAGFSPTVDAQRLDSIRRKLARGQHMITAHDARFLLAIIDGRVIL